MVIFLSLNFLEYFSATSPLDSYSDVKNPQNLLTSAPLTAI